LNYTRARHRRVPHLRPQQTAVASRVSSQNG